RYTYVNNNPLSQIDPSGFVNIGLTHCVDACPVPGPHGWGFISGGIGGNDWGGVGAGAGSEDEMDDVMADNPAVISAELTDFVNGLNAEVDANIDAIVTASAAATTTVVDQAITNSASQDISNNNAALETSWQQNNSSNPLAPVTVTSTQIQLGTTPAPLIPPVPLDGIPSWVPSSSLPALGFKGVAQLGMMLATYFLNEPQGPLPYEPTPPGPATAPAQTTELPYNPPTPTNTIEVPISPRAPLPQQFEGVPEQLELPLTLRVPFVVE
ncbi:MAG: hypothetical protein WA747_03520, partial [Steroidobacteraceae bacterium]